MTTPATAASISLERTGFTAEVPQRVTRFIRGVERPAPVKFPSGLWDDFENGDKGFISEGVFAEEFGIAGRKVTKRSQRGSGVFLRKNSFGAPNLRGFDGLGMAPLPSAS